MQLSTYPNVHRFSCIALEAPGSWSFTMALAHLRCCQACRNPSLAIDKSHSITSIFNRSLPVTKNDGWKWRFRLFPQQQNAMGSLHNIDFGVFWASWGRSRKEPGSGNRFRETGFLPTRGIAKVLGSEGCVPEVSKVSLFDGLGPVPEVWTERDLGTWFREPEVFKKRSQGSESYFVL